MKLDAKKYDEMRKAASPPSPLLKDCLWAFFVGGAICLLGEGLRTLYAALGFTLTDAGTLTSATLIGLSAFTTAMGWYQKLAAKAGAGTLVPITGFANAVVAPRHRIPQRGACLRRGCKNVHHRRACHRLPHAGQRCVGRDLPFHPPADGRVTHA